MIRKFFLALLLLLVAAIPANAGIGETGCGYGGAGAFTTLSTSGNVGIGTSTFPANLAKGIAWASGTAASADVADQISLWIADRGGTAGKASLHIRAEDGTQHVFGDKVGIGTLTPASDFTINGAVELPNYIGWINIRDTGSSLRGILGMDDGNFAAGDIVRLRNPAGPIVLQPLSASNMGIGTETAPEQLLELNEVQTITGAVTDGYAAALRVDPGYTAATAQTVTRHNYIDLQQPSVAGAGPAALTDAAVFRFDAAIGTHKATTAAFQTTDSGAHTTDWAGGIIVNINGTLYKIPFVAK